MIRLLCVMLACTLAIGFVPAAAFSCVVGAGQAYAADESGADESAGSDEGAEGESEPPAAPGGASEPEGPDVAGSSQESNDSQSAVDAGGSGDSGGYGGSGGAGGSGGSSGSEKPGKEDEPSGSDEPSLPGDVDSPDIPERYFVETLLLKWDKPDGDGITHFVGDSPIVERSYQQVKITEFGETVQLNGWYLSTDGTGTAYQTANSETRIGSFSLAWSSSDDSIATVGPDGLVTPHGKNGSVVITATVDDPNVYEGSAPTATVTVVFDGQDGKYVKKVEIIDEAGKVIGEDWGGTTVYDRQNEFHQLQARITWINVVDKSETVEVTGSGDEYRASNVGTTITWNVSSSEAFTINKDTGRLKTGQYSGNAYVTCTAVGGIGGKEIADTANVQLDTGVYEYNPADSLTLKVVWEERPDEVVKEQTFTLAELESLLSHHHVNATVVNNSRYGVISADGYLFKDVVGLIGVADEDVMQYRFGTADGYDNPVSYKYLFGSGNRYYFRNYDIGSRAEGEIVPPLLAYQSRLMWGQSEADPTWELDEGMRFRLVFGCLASGDANTSFQIYYIHTITIVLAGAPSAGGNGVKDDAGDEPEGPGDSGKDDGKGAGGSGHGKSGKGSGSNGSGGANSPGAMQGRDGDGAQPAGATGSSDDVESSSGGDAAEAADDADEVDDAAGADIGSSKRWRVYQMMNKSNSDVPDWDDENPISPFAAPIVFGTFAIGAGATGIGFRRRLR